MSNRPDGAIAMFYGFVSIGVLRESAEFHTWALLSGVDNTGKLIELVRS